MFFQGSDVQSFTFRPRRYVTYRTIRRGLKHEVTRGRAERVAHVPGLAVRLVAGSYHPLMRSHEAVPPSLDSSGVALAQSRLVSGGSFAS